LQDHVRCVKSQTITASRVACDETDDAVMAQELDG
jgi:hypothetical protein